MGYALAIWGRKRDRSILIKYLCRTWPLFHLGNFFSAVQSVAPEVAYPARWNHLWGRRAVTRGGGNCRAGAPGGSKGREGRGRSQHNTYDIIIVKGVPVYSDPDTGGGKRGLVCRDLFDVFCGKNSVFCITSVLRIASYHI